MQQENMVIWEKVYQVLPDTPSPIIRFFLKRMYVQQLVYQVSICCYQFEGDSPFGLKLNDKQVAVTFKRLVLPDVYERGVQWLGTVGMKPVICKVFHVFHTQWLYTYKFIVGRIVS